MKNLIAISGKIGSGKDTVGAIILALTGTGFGDDKSFETFKKTGMLPISTNQSPFVVKKFAGKLKDMVCLMIGCTREQLEDAEFKNTVLGPEWSKYGIVRAGGRRIIEMHSTEKDAKVRLPVWGEGASIEQVLLTPRLLLQILGTDCCRDMIHPNTWVNALFADYKEDLCIATNHPHSECLSTKYPSWLITDMRFPNEFYAVKQRNGFTIRVTRDTEEYDGIAQHPSETALDSAQFDYNLDNNGTIEDLVEKVKAVLELEKVI